ncbi:MAG: hypothetical protein WC623_24555 [Pedobacter sp.]|uniref:hypothetical protein n=1 Tax=Pedobacter sp. TaxID=1411316 RepID=UPI003565E638
MESVTIKFEGIDNLLKKYSPEIVKTAIKRSLSLATRRGKTFMSIQVREKFNIKKSDVDRNIMARPRLSELKSELLLIGKPISLMYFGAYQVVGGRKLYGAKVKGRKPLALAQQLKTTRAKGGGVYEQIIKGRRTFLQKPISIGGKSLGKPFIGFGRGRVPMVFRRETGSESSTYKGKEKLVAMKSITYASILQKPQNISRVKQLIEETLGTECKRQVEEVLK